MSVNLQSLFVELNDPKNFSKFGQKIEAISNLEILENNEKYCNLRFNCLYNGQKATITINDCDSTTKLENEKQEAINIDMPTGGQLWHQINYALKRNDVYLETKRQVMYIEIAGKITSPTLIRKIEKVQEIPQTLREVEEAKTASVSKVKELKNELEEARKLIAQLQAANIK